MTGGYRTALGLALLLVPVFTVLADTVSEEQSQAELMILAGQLSGWVASQTGYVEPELPRIRLETQACLEQLCYPGFPHELLPEIKGAYVAESGTVYLRKGFRSERPVDVSYLVHELVHHLQLANLTRDRKRTKSALEAEALRIQIRWLRENGVADAMDVLGVNEASLRRLEAAPR